MSKWLSLSAGVTLVALTACHAPVYHAKALSAEQLAPYLMARRVAVMAPLKDGRLSASNLGSAAPIHPDGYLITAAHVVDGTDRERIKVMLAGRKKVVDARLVMMDRGTDVALLKANMATPCYLDWSPSGCILPSGMPVVHTGLATSHKTGVGRLTTSAVGDQRRLEHSLQLEPGDSGGALVSLAGQIVAINSAVGRIESFGTSFFSGSYSNRPNVRRIESLIAKDIAAHRP